MSNPHPDNPQNLKNYGTPGAPLRNQEMENPTKPWSIKNALRHLGAQEVDPDDKGAVKRLLTNNGKRKPTMAEIAAARLYTEAAQGNIGATRTILDHVDGRATQTVNLGGQGPSNPIRSSSVISSSSAEEAYREMLDG